MKSRAKIHIICCYIWLLYIFAIVFEIGATRSASWNVKGVAVLTGILGLINSLWQLRKENRVR